MLINKCYHMNCVLVAICCFVEARKLPRVSVAARDSTAVSKSKLWTLEKAVSDALQKRDAEAQNSKKYEKSYFGPISDQSRFWGVYFTFMRFGMLAWIRSGHGIQNALLKCRFHIFL